MKNIAFRFLALGVIQSKALVLPGLPGSIFHCTPNATQNDPPARLPPSNGTTSSAINQSNITSPGQNELFPTFKTNIGYAVAAFLGQYLEYRLISVEAFPVPVQDTQDPDTVRDVTLLFESGEGYRRKKESIPAQWGSWKESVDTPAGRQEGRPLLWSSVLLDIVQANERFLFYFRRFDWYAVKIQKGEQESGLDPQRVYYEFFIELIAQSVFVDAIDGSVQLRSTVQNNTTSSVGGRSLIPPNSTVLHLSNRSPSFKDNVATGITSFMQRYPLGKLQVVQAFLQVPVFETTDTDLIDIVTLNFELPGDVYRGKMSRPEHWGSWSLSEPRTRTDYYPHIFFEWDSFTMDVATANERLQASPYRFAWKTVRVFSGTGFILRKNRVYYIFSKLFFPGFYPAAAVDALTGEVIAI